MVMGLAVCSVLSQFVRVMLIRLVARQNISAECVYKRVLYASLVCLTHFLFPLRGADEWPVNQLFSKTMSMISTSMTILWS